jgi:NhaP-type Na+/H+ or K+/H+ antiporter
VSEGVAFVIFGVALSAALTAAVGRGFVLEHGPKVIPALCIFAVLLGLLLGWAINGYLAYVRESAMRF